MSSRGPSSGRTAGVVLCSLMLLAGPPAMHIAAAEEARPGFGGDAEEYQRRWKTSPGGATSRDATPNHLFRAVQDFIAEVNLLREELGVYDFPREGEPQENRAPVHLYAKTLELGHKVRRIQQRFGVAGAPVARMPATEIALDHVLDSMGLLLVELHKVKSRMEIDRNIEPVAPGFGKTPAMVYKGLSDASFLLDGILGLSTTTNDVYRNATVVLAELELVARFLGVDLDLEPKRTAKDRVVSPIEAPRLVTEVVRQTLEANRKAIDLQGRLGMDPSGEPGLALVRVTLSEAYDLTSTLLAELSRLKFHLGVDDVPDEGPEPTDKRLPDLLGLISLVAANLDRVAGGVTAELSIQLREKHEAMERERLEQEARRQRQEEADRALELEQQRQAEAERQAALERLREVEAERERELERMRQSEADMGREIERLRQAEQELRRLEAQARQDGDPARQDGDSDTAEAPAAAAAQAQAPTLSPCPVLSAPNANDLIPGYPRRGRIDYGNAVITVSFTVDDAGETVDEEVAVVPERSRADQSAHFDRFAQAAVRQVQEWSVELPDRDELSCSMAQKVSITVRFDY